MFQFVRNKKKHFTIVVQETNRHKRIEKRLKQIVILKKNKVKKNRNITIRKTKKDITKKSVGKVSNAFCKKNTIFILQLLRKRTQQLPLYVG